MTNKLSVAIATYNEENNLKKCLQSVRNMTNDIVVVDGGSTDNTLDIAKEFTNTIIKTDNPPIFHINKQKAVEECKNDWILQMDADEQITSGLANEISAIVSNENSKDGYFIARNNYFVNKRMKKGGMYPDYVVRLFRKGKGVFPCESVHEQIKIGGDVGYLKAPMNHFPYPTFAEYKKKADTYTSLTAQELKEQKLPRSAVSWMRYTFAKPAITFLSLYIRHQGFIDGWWGFVWALYSGLHYAQAYKKYTTS